jgi:hypothetical protein
MGYPIGSRLQWSDGLYEVVAATPEECITCAFRGDHNDEKHARCPGAGRSYKKLDSLYEDLLKVKEADSEGNTYNNRDK